MKISPPREEIASDAKLLRRLDYDAVSDPTAAQAAARIRQLLAELSVIPGLRLHVDLEGCERVRHVRRGSEYIVLASDGDLQSSGGPVPEGTRLTTYMGADWRLWHRPSAEFRDGRFVRLGA